MGCGRVGSQIAANMDREGHEVVIVDRDPNAFSRAANRGVLGNSFKGDQVVGNGTDVDVLRRAGIERADGFVAVTEGDNRNIMASQIAKHVFKVPHVVTRIYDPSVRRPTRSWACTPSARPSKAPSTSSTSCWSAASTVCT